MVAVVKIRMFKIIIATKDYQTNGREHPYSLKVKERWTVVTSRTWRLQSVGEGEWAAADGEVVQLLRSRVKST